MGGRRRFDPILLLLIVVVILGIFQLFHYGRQLGRPFGGFVADRFIVDNYWFVAPSTPPWWEGIAEAGLRHGDRIVALDGQPYGRDHDEAFAAARAADRSSVTLAVYRGEEMMTVRTPLVPFRLAHLLDLKLPGFINGIGFLLLAIAVYAARPQHPANRLFTIASSLVVAHRWLVYPSPFLDEGGLTNFLELMRVMVAPFVGPAAIHLALLFPQRSQWLSRRLLAVLYGVGALVATSLITSRLVWWQLGWTPAGRWLERAGYQGAIVLMAAGALFFIGRYVWLRQHSRPGTRLHRQVSVIVSGFIFTSPFLFVVIMEGFMTPSVYYLAGLDLRFLLMAVPLGFAYAILRYQTFHSRDPALLGVFIYGSSALVASAGAWLVRQTLAVPSTAFVIPPFVPIFVVTLGVGFFWSTQSSWRGLFGRLMHRRIRGYRATMRLAQRLADHLDAGDVPERMAQALVDELGLEQAAIWLVNGDDEVALAGRAGQWTSPPMERLPLAVEELATIESPLRLTPAVARREGLRPLAEQEEVEVVAPLRVKERSLGLLALGRRWDEEIFDDADMDVVVLVAQQAALFVLAARQIAVLRDVPQRMAEAQERERQRIARELHDTIQQILGRLPFYLEAVRHSLRANQEETERLLMQSMDDVERAAQAVRQIQQDLTPGQLKQGLVEPLRDVTRRFGERTGIEVELELGPNVDQALSLRSRHALYRVMQQALDNVAAHAEAKRVVVELSPEEGGVSFCIVDDGRGFSAAERRAAVSEGSFGLQSMAARVRSEGGAFYFHSTPGQGTEINGWLPSDA